MVQVRLDFGVGGRQVAYLREPTGHDELALGCASPPLAADVVARLLVAAPGALDPARARELTLSDRDRLIAELYRICFGDSVECVVPCPHCGKHFELEFTLSALLASVSRTRPDAVVEGPDANGVYALASGARFRLPTVEDECLAAAADPAQSLSLLVERCLVAGDPQRDGEAIQAAMDELGPVLSFDLPARCAECRRELTTDFGMLGFFLAEFVKERPLLMREVHCLATSYRWSPNDVLGLARTQRRSLVGLILGEDAERGEAWVA